MFKSPFHATPLHEPASSASLALALLGCNICAVCTLSVGPCLAGLPRAWGFPGVGGAYFVPSNSLLDWFGTESRYGSVWDLVIALHGSRTGARGGVSEFMDQCFQWIQGSC